MKLKSVKYVKLNLHFYLHTTTKIYQCLMKLNDPWKCNSANWFLEACGTMWLSYIITFQNC